MRYKTNEQLQNDALGSYNPQKNLSDLGYEGNNLVDPDQVNARNNLYESVSVLNDGDELVHLLWSNGIYRKQDFDDFNSFYIFPRNDPYKMVGSAKEYVFFTKPDLHIFGSRPANSTTKLDNLSILNPELRPIPFFNDLDTRGYRNTVLKSLNYSADQSVPFVNILSNYKVSNLDLSNVSVGDEETSPNIYNTRIYYRKPSDSADEEFEFSMEFKDNKYLDCYLWFKAYDMYEKLKYQGKVTPTTYDYVYYKALSDQMTAFKFIVGEDNETILYWAQLWGVYPKSVPRSSFSELPTDGQFRFTVEFKSTFQEDMNPMSIIHFNKLAQLYRSGHSVTEMDLFDQKSLRVTGEAAKMPYITRSLTSDPHSMYLLKWVK